MKKWQEERNYRRVRNEGGEVIANIITVDGMDVEVPEDVYLAYAQADRRERYIMEEQSSGKLLSLEQMEEDALLPDYVGAETAPSAETEALEREGLRNLAEQKQILLLALLSLKDTDRELINALFFECPSLFLENCIPAIRITTRTEERAAQCAPRPAGSLAASRSERLYLRRGGVGSAARRDAVRADNETQCTGQHEEAGLLRD